MSTLYCTGYLYCSRITVVQSGTVGASRGTHVIPLLMPSLGVLFGAEALYVPGLTALAARGGVFQISCEVDQLGLFGLQLCAGCDGGYV